MISIVKIVKKYDKLVILKIFLKIVAGNKKRLYICHR
jgi:hypothetical protein